MEPKGAIFLHDGITLQHAGELLLGATETEECRKQCSETYRRSLEDFVTVLFYGGRFATAAGASWATFEEQEKREHPGLQLARRFEKHWLPLEKTNAPGLADHFGDAKFVGQVEHCIRQLEYAVDSESPRRWWYEFVAREANKYLGPSDTLAEPSLEPDQYRFDKEYLREQKNADVRGRVTWLTRQVPEQFKSNMADHVSICSKEWQHPAVRNASRPALEEFVAACTVTHLAIFVWYGFVEEHKCTPDMLWMPHVTRVSLGTATERDRLFAKYRFCIERVLFEVLKRSKDRDDMLRNHLPGLRDEKRYSLARDRILELSLTAAGAPRDNACERLANEITNLARNEKGILTDVMKAWPISPQRFWDRANGLLRPKPRAFRDLIQGFDDREYQEHLYRVFPELMADH